MAVPGTTYPAIAPDVWSLGKPLAWVAVCRGSALSRSNWVACIDDAPYLCGSPQLPSVAVCVCVCDGCLAFRGGVVRHDHGPTAV